MKLASYIADGQACFGVVIGDGVLTLNRRLGNRYATLRDALAAGALAEIRKAVDTAKPDHRLNEVEWLPVIPNPEKILCAGINYRSHAAETGRDIPKQPSMFIRLATTLTGHEGKMIAPRCRKASTSRASSRSSSVVAAGIFRSRALLSTWLATPVSSTAAYAIIRKSP